MVSIICYQVIRETLLTEIIGAEDQRKKREQQSYLGTEHSHRSNS
jgi:hypothetical protein